MGIILTTLQVVVRIELNEKQPAKHPRQSLAHNRVKEEKSMQTIKI